MIAERNQLLEENKRIGNEIVKVRRDIDEFKGLARDLNEKDGVIRELSM